MLHAAKFVNFFRYFVNFFRYFVNCAEHAGQSRHNAQASVGVKPPLVGDNPFGRTTGRAFGFRPD